MSNTGKFVDRNPNIPTAGKISKVDNLVPCINYHSLDDKLEAVLPLRQRKDPNKEHYPMAGPKVPVRGGYYTQVRSLVSPGRQSSLADQLIQLRQEESSKGLPVGMDPLVTTFGMPTGVSKQVDHVADMIFPNIPYGETRLAEELGLELYQRSHNHYLVGQRIDQKYDAPTNVTYGKIKSLNQTGLLTKKTLKWFNQEAFSRTSKGQARVRERSHFEVGKALTPNNILEKLGEGHTFGGITHFDDTGVREGMRLGPVNKSKQVNAEYVTFVCSIREAIKKKEPPFPFFDLVTNLKLIDEKGCGCLPIGLVYEVCERLGLYFDREMFEIILTHLGVLHGEKMDTISYHGFCNLLDIRKPLPEFAKVDDLPDDLKLYESTYQGLAKDLQKKNECINLKTAGVPTLRTDKINPGTTMSKGDRFLLVDETSLDACLRPSIFSYYGLTTRDFFQPRTKEYMRDLWKRVGLDIPDNIFEEMWKEGLTRQENDGKSVCIETFRNMLDELCEAKLVEVRES